MISAVRLSAIPIVVAFAAVATPMDRQVTGTVRDASSGQPVEGAQVHVVGTGFGAITSADGRYTLRLPELYANTTVKLVARRIGYSSAERDVRFDSASVIADFALAPATAGLHVQTITAEQGFYTGSATSIANTTRAARRMVGRAAPQAPAAPGARDARERKAAVVADSIAVAAGNTESYDRIVDNPFIATGVAPRSTFSIDVDRASYANVRRYLTSGTLPPRDAVRIEEMLNYFAYHYPQPRGADPFSVTTEVVPAPWNPHHRLVRVGLQGRQANADTLPPSNLVFLIDVSGSMQMPDKLPLLKAAFRLLVNQLREEDRVAIVVYAGAAGLVLPSTSGADKTRILDAIDALEAGGSTAGGAGLRLAYHVAGLHHLPHGTNRVILATDGDFNVGVSSDAEMVRLVEEQRAHGTSLTVLGFGTGNLKDSKMEKLADHGNGNYAYIDDLAEARKTLVREIGGTLVTIAKDVKVQIEFNPAKVAGYRLIGYENRMLRDEDFDDDTKDAGELGAGHSVTALYEIVPVGAPYADSLRTPGALRYQEAASLSRSSRTDELMDVQLRYKPPTADVSRLLRHTVRDRHAAMSADLSFASAVAAFGMVLRDSPYKGSASFEQALALGEAGVGRDPHGDRAEFLDLVRRARTIAGGTVAAADR